MRKFIFEGEEYEECKSYPSYFCSKSGNILSIMYIGGQGREDFNRAHKLSPKIDKDGYHEYTLKVDGKRLTRKAHRIIAEQFSA